MLLTTNTMYLSQYQLVSHFNLRWDLSGGRLLYLHIDRVVSLLIGTQSNRTDVRQLITPESH